MGHGHRYSKTTLFGQAWSLIIQVSLQGSTKDLSSVEMFHYFFFPMCAVEADFDTSVITLEFPSDTSSPVNELSAPISLEDDEINEAVVQIFIIYLKIINSTNPDLIATDRFISQGIIVDEDRKSL